MNSIGKKIDSEFENMFFTAQEICKENRQKNEEYGLCLILKTKQEENKNGIQVIIGRLQHKRKLKKTVRDTVQSI